MNKLTYVGLDRELYYEKLSNGLEIFVLPMPKYNNIFATFTSKYGSNHNGFRIKGQKEYNVVPHGIAHFLEHTLFESKTGVDPFEFFSKSGSHCNANTWLYRTVYLFEGLDNFNNNLNYLIDFVQDPYLTDENVLKEKGIITEEAKMYLDYPSERLDIITKNNLFHHDYMKINTIGTLESINSITKEDLQLCYNTFYHPSNMFVVVAGPVNPEEVINTIKENQLNKDFGLPIEIEFNEIEEPNNTIKEYEETRMDVNVPKVVIAYKINYEKFDMPKSQLMDYLFLYLKIKFDFTSLFTNNLIDSKKILSNISFDINLAKKHLLIEIYFDSDYYEEVTKLIKEEMLNKDFDDFDFTRKKNAMVASLVSHGDSVQAIVYDLIENYTTLNLINLEVKENLEKLNEQELRTILNIETFEHNTTTTLRPLKD